MGGNQKILGSTAQEYSPVAMGMVLRTQMPYNKCHSGLTVVQSGRVTELCVAASCVPAMQVRKSDISSVQTSILC